MGVAQKGPNIRFGSVAGSIAGNTWLAASERLAVTHLESRRLTQYGQEQTVRLPQELKAAFPVDR